MPHNSIPGHGEFHETPAAGTPTAIAAQHAGTTPDAYVAEHGQASASDRGAAARGPLGSDGSHAAGRSTESRAAMRAAGRAPWYDDDRFGLAVSGVVIIGVLVAAWYVHRDED